MWVARMVPSESIKHQGRLGAPAVDAEIQARAAHSGWMVTPLTTRLTVPELLGWSGVLPSDKRAVKCVELTAHDVGKYSSPSPAVGQMRHVQVSPCVDNVQGLRRDGDDAAGQSRPSAVRAADRDRNGGCTDRWKRTRTPACRGSRWSSGRGESRAANRRRPTTLPSVNSNSFNAASRASALKPLLPRYTTRE